MWNMKLKTLRTFASTPNRSDCTRCSMKMKFAAILFLSLFNCLAVLGAKIEVENVNNTINVPPDKKTCSCSWSQWMDSGLPEDAGMEDETYDKLRSAGYKFCESPVDIQCYNLAMENQELSFGAICKVNIGFTCPLLCDNYAVRVACCYCAPEATGPEFQISSQSSAGGCLRAVPADTDGETSSLSVVDTCDFSDKAQSWVWVAKYVIKNIKTQQCLAVDSGSVVLENCDTSLKRQRWKYIDRSKTLQYFGASPYSYLKKVDSAVSLDSDRGRDSQWLAKVEEGKTSLKNMRNFPCESLSKPENGNIACTLGDYVSSKCEFSCDYGYRLPEDFENDSECTDDGLFTLDTPKCEKIECPVIEAIDHGTVTCSNVNTLDSSCIFRCDAGYALIGSNQLICTHSDEWTDEQPTCERVVCSPDLEKESISNGAVNCTSGFYFASKCTYTCHEGYDMEGPAIRSCQMDETWDQSKPVCNKIQCPPIVAASNSQMSCTAGTDYLSTCKFSCDTGYTMVGSATSVCTADKTWGSEPPTCERKTCNALSAPENGDMFCDDKNFYASKCSFTCDRGFQIEGEESLKCTDEGWNFGAPICKQITCGRQTNPANGAVSCTNDEIYGSACTFSCNHGYKLNGEDSIICTEDGWNETAPTCDQITCPAIPPPKNGIIYCPAANVYQSKCFLACNEGYTPEGSRGPVTCQINGLWSSSIATCTQISCPHLTIRQGVMTCTNMYHYNSTCTFACKDGFNLLGAQQAKCTGTGWDAQAPSCGRVTCSPPLARPSNGQIKCVTKGRPDCTFSCNTGYDLIGATVSECQKDETWSVTDIPICQVVECPKLPSEPLYGNMTCTKETTFDSTCEFKCKTGYSLVGEPQTRCTEKRTWDHETPKCQKISCPDLAHPSNGQIECTDSFSYQSSCTYKCDQGFKLKGLHSTNCLHNKAWSEAPPYCERVTCSPSYTNPSNGKVACSDGNNYDSVCTFTCEDGFSLQGSKQSTCEESGWSLEEAPTCRQITCSETDGLPNGSIQCDRSNLYNSRCKYSCNRGYELAGAKYAVCTEEGTWSNDLPSCTEIRCPVIPKPEHGLVICGKNNMYSSECQFMCKEGYTRKPDINSFTCMENRRWNPAGFPTCEVANVTLAATQPPTTTSRATTARSTTTSSTTTTTTTVSTTTEEPAPETTQAAPSDVGGFSKAPPSSQHSPMEVTTSPKFMATSDTVVLGTPQSSADVTSSDVNVNSEKNVDDEGGFPVIIVAAIGAAVAVLVAILVGVFLWRKKARKKSKYQNGPSASLKSNNRYDHTELGPLIPNGNGTTGGKKYGAISMDRLEMEYNRRHADDDKLFREEYHSLVDGTGSKEAGGRAKNKEKNRYTNILPYDHSRVVLPKVGIDADSDYINASFVDGYKHKGKFIAAQGPKTNTVADFWRMIWEQNVSTIIMATNLEERKEQKCALYWPESEVKETYGDLVVTHLGENHLVDYTIRMFSVQRISGQGDATMSMKRNIKQYHFTSWPDFGVPKSPSGILKFLRKIKHGSPTGYGPIVVHCSAGVGRTGTFICIDAMMDMISRENKIDVFGFSSQMRQQRPEMVQTEQQYIFIYQAILEHHLYGDTEVEASEVSGHIEDLMQRLPGNVTGMEHEFKKLTSIRIQKEHMRAGNHPANMRKNRVLLILPYDWNRVMLPIKRGQENTDYINASYIDGYRQKDAYIATQGPLPHTTEDFWRMIWNSECASIVMLTELVERGQAKCAQYWPNDGWAMYGDIEVELVSTLDNEDYTERDFKVSNSSSNAQKQLIVKQFHYHGWPEVGAPVSGYSMIELVEAVQKQQQNSGNNPIVIHCSAGAGRTGAFCALSTALEQVKAEGVLDMFQIVKCLRMQRPHMVQNLEQYEFCYRAVQEYIDSMSEYYNFK